MHVRFIFVHDRKHLLSNLVQKKSTWRVPHHYPSNMQNLQVDSAPMSLASALSRCFPYAPSLLCSSSLSSLEAGTRSSVPIVPCAFRTFILSCPPCTVHFWQWLGLCFVFDYMSVLKLVPGSEELEHVEGNSLLKLSWAWPPRSTLCCTECRYLCGPKHCVGLLAAEVLHSQYVAIIILEIEISMTWQAISYLGPSAY